MFEKNRRGAITLSAITVGSAALGIALVRLIEALTGRLNVDWIDAVYIALLTPLTVGVVSGLLALIISTLDATHYGRAGAVRWAAVGIGFGVWWGVASHLLPPFESVLVERIVRGVLQISIALWLYWLMFKALPPRVTLSEPVERITPDD